MEWVLMIINLIMGCLNNNSEEGVFRILRRGGPAVSFSLMREGRQNGLRGKKLRQFVQDSLDDLNDASDEDLKQLIEDVKVTKEFPLDLDED